MAKQKLNPGMKVDLLVNGKSVGEWIVVNRVSAGLLIAQLSKGPAVQLGPVDESILRVAIEKPVTKKKPRKNSERVQPLPV